MPRPSTIALLDESFRQRITDLIRDKVSYDEIADMMNAEFEEAGIEIRISKSAIGRYGKTVRETAQRMEETQEFARGLALSLGEKEGDATFDLMVEMMSHLMFKALRAQTMDDVKKVFNTGDFMKMAAAMKMIAETKLKDINYQRELRAEIAKQAAQVAGEALREQGVTAEAIKFAQTSILGMRRDGGA